MNFRIPWSKSKQSFPIVRVDDRLIHGQVIVGWGQALDLNPIWLASDRITSNDGLAQAFAAMFPSEMNGGVKSLSDVAQAWKEGELKSARPMIVVESTGDALKLHQLGAPLKELMLGGMHFREGSEELLPYVFLSSWDRLTLAELKAKGVRILCQDLPTTTPLVYRG